MTSSPLFSRFQLRYASTPPPMARYACRDTADDADATLALAAIIDIFISYASTSQPFIVTIIRFSIAPRFSSYGLLSPAITPLPADTFTPFSLFFSPH
jgi:hypothetical protein